MRVNRLCESIAKYVFFNSSCSGKLMMVQHEFHFCYNAFYLENSLVLVFLKESIILIQSVKLKIA